MLCSLSLMCARRSGGTVLVYTIDFKPFGSHANNDFRTKLQGFSGTSRAGGKAAPGLQHGLRNPRPQNIENNPMHSSHGCTRDVYGFSEIG